jgi:HK97 gp10 family phage protein
VPTRIRITRIVDADDLARQIEPKMERMGHAIAHRMQRLVPKRTWALHDTIVASTVRTGGKVRTEVGAGSDDVDYEDFVERGTSRQKAQPFMRPALHQSTARDFGFTGGDPRRHGVVRIVSRRERAEQRRANARAAAAQRRSDRRENEAES